MGFIGIGCPAHILHNTASTSADVLSVDVESVVLKIYKYFRYLQYAMNVLNLFVRQPMSFMQIYNPTQELGGCHYSRQ